MQNFLPYPNFIDSAKCLDMKRLGNQRNETWVCLKTLDGEESGWANHPAVRIWKGFQPALCVYGICICEEWRRGRGYKDTMLPRFQERLEKYKNTNSFKQFGPDWLGDDRFHSSHRAALLYKNHSHYCQFGWTEEPKLDYFWPKVVDNLG